MSTGSEKIKHKLLDYDLFDEHYEYQIGCVYHVLQLIFDDKAHFIRYSRHKNFHVLVKEPMNDCFDCEARKGFTRQLGYEIIYDSPYEWREATVRNVFDLFEGVEA